MRIGELAKRSGVSPRSLRYYEQQGLLSSTRSETGQRHYSDADAARVSLIQQLFEAGMTSRLIASVLPCVETPDDPGVVEDAFVTMTRLRERIDADIAYLTTTRTALDGLIAGNRRYHQGSMTGAGAVPRSAP